MVNESCLKFPHLFTPFVIGDTIFRNRIFTSPTGYMDFHRDGSTLTEEAIAYYERKAIGGAATVCIGECHIKPEVSRAGKLGVDITDDVSMRVMARLADRIKRLGAVPSMELQHGGLAAEARLGPSDVYVAGDSSIPCHPMTEEQILDTIELFANAAARAKYYGFDMVTVHGGHGWLLQQFFSPATNLRTDKWGGSVENRARLAVAVCDAIHDRCGKGFPIEIRISVTEFEDGYDVPEGIEYAKQLDGHADIIHCSAGLHGHTKRGNSLRWAPSMYQEGNPFVDYAAEVKKQVTKSMVSSIGGHTDPVIMEEILRSGKADIINIARALNCDPDLPNKARAGKDNEIKKCIRCYGCSDAIFPRFCIFCALSPESGHENEFAAHSAPLKKQRVLVAGGGIGGMEAAISSAKMGHEVVLYEKRSELGGVILCERKAPFKKHLHEYIDLQKTLLEKHNVKVYLNTKVTPALIEEMNPDVVIASIGGKHASPQIKGVDGANVIPVEIAFENHEQLGERTLIIGAGPSGAELAVFLSMIGKQVTVIEKCASMPGPQVQGIVTKIELEDRGVFINFETDAIEITSEGVYCNSPDGRVFFEADSVVTATGVSPLINEAFELSAVSKEFHMIGDCSGGKSIMDATGAARTIVKVIGTY